MWASSPTEMAKDCRAGSVYPAAGGAVDDRRGVEDAAPYDMN